MYTSLFFSVMIDIIMTIGNYTITLILFEHNMARGISKRTLATLVISAL